MRTLSISALTLCFVLCGSAFSAEPQVTEPTAPEVTPAVVSDPLTAWQDVALRSAERLDQLDDKVAELRATCDGLSQCSTQSPAFVKVIKLRASVLAALINLRNPETKFEAGASTLAIALTELDLAVQALARTVADLTPRPNS